MSRIERTAAPSSGGSLTKEQEEKLAGIPAAGSKGQVLTKKTAASYDDEWATPTGGPPSGVAGGDLAGEYPNPTIGPEKVVEADIKALAVSEGKLTALAVTTAKLAAEAVTAGKLAAESVETAKIKLLAITEALLAGEAVSAAKLKGEAVTEAKIATGAVSEGKLGAEAVSEGKLKALAVTAGKIAAGAVTAAKLGAEAVETAAIKAAAVTEAKLAAGVTERLLLTGGTTGQALVKKSNTNFETEWATVSGGTAPSWVAVEGVNAKLEKAEVKAATDGLGFTHLTGTVTIKESFAGGTTFFTLPVAHRPAVAKNIWVNRGEANGILVVVGINGEVRTFANPTATFLISFDGVIFSHEH